MTNPLINDDDLDPDFTPDPDMLDTSGKPANIQVITPVKPVVTEVPNATPSVEQLISAKLVEVKNNNSKITNLRDVHDAIVSAESVCRSDAESIQLATESFLSPRLSLNGFTDIRSSINFKESNLFLKNKISELDTANRALVASIATESVIEYASSILAKNTATLNKVDVHADAEKSQKGIFIAKDGAMVNLSKEKLSKLQEFLTGSEVSDEIKLAIGNLLTAENSETVATFIELRISGSTVDTAVNSIRLKRLSSERGDINVSISDITTYLTTMLAEDHEAIFSMYTGYRYHLEADIASIKASVEKPEVFVDKVTDAMANFSNTELLEELLFKIPLFVAVINKLIDTAKF